MKSYFNQPSSSKKGAEEEEDTVIMPSHYNGRVGIAAMARKLSNRVSNLCGGGAGDQTFDGQGSTFDHREVRQRAVQPSVIVGPSGAVGDLETENKTLKNEICELKRMLML
jgi:hypothetical protein